MKLTLGRYEIEVLPATRAMALKRAGLMLEAEKRWEGRSPESSVDSLMKYDECFTYPSLAACSAGTLPSYEEFQQMGDVDSSAWENAAVQVNPHWFPLESSLTPEQESKKNATTQTPSTSD